MFILSLKNNAIFSQSITKKLQGICGSWVAMTKRGDTKNSLVKVFIERFYIKSLTQRLSSCSPN